MIAQFSLALLLALSGILPQSGRPNFSGRWQFDEAQSNCEQATKIIKDLPANLQAKIPSFDVPRLAEPPRFFIKPPIVVTKHIGASLSISAPPWFKHWLGENSVLVVDDKERIKNYGGESTSSWSVRWDGNRIVREWKEKNAIVYDSCEGRQVFTVSEDGKSLTYDSHTKCLFSATVDGRTYEAEDSQNIHTMLVKKRRP
jgi:hypothetical protein